MFTNHHRRSVFPVLALAAVAAIGLAACSSGSTAGLQPVAAITQPTAAPVDMLRIGIMEDQTGSRRTTRTERVTGRVIDRLVDLLMRTGGNLLVGAIRDDSNRPLVRLSVPRGPVPPPPPADTGNPFQAAEARARFEASQKLYAERHAAWERDVQASVAEFRTAALALLAREDEASRTDVWGGLQRIDLALSEPVPEGRTMAAYILFVSDADDNRRLPHEALRSAATLLLVNGAGHLGVLAALNPLRFEALDPAVDYVVNRETK